MAVEQGPTDAFGDKYEDYPEDAEQDYSAEDIVRIASEMKEFGNKAFKAGDLDLGLEKYEKGLRYLNEYPEPDEEDDPKNLGKQLENLRFTIHSNSALVQIKLRSFEDALRSASSALDVNPAVTTDAEKAKALYRRALARVALKNDEEAIVDLEQAAKLVPGDAGVVKELAAAKKREADRVEKEKAVYRKFFS